jgi:hypothetical protein
MKKNLKLEISCQTPFKGLVIVTETSQHYFVYVGEILTGRTVRLWGTL